MGTENDINDLRVPSFSCYLQPIEGVVNMFDAGEKFTDMALMQRKSSSGKRWFHSCAGPCSSKKAVYVQQSIKKEDHFTFPVMINPTMEILSNKEQNIQVPRMSIEVFGSGTVNKGNISKNLVRKMSILTWDAIPNRKESVICDDFASEGSSDLFEIENLSRTGWQPESSCLSPSTRYVPCEASIEWSVVTTSARTKIEPPKHSQKKLDNGLLGCNSFKSVQVVEPVYRMTDKSKH